MAIFQNIEYKYYDINNNYLGTSEGFFAGLEKYPSSSYAIKYIDGVEVKERVIVQTILN